MRPTTASRQGPASDNVQRSCWRALVAAFDARLNGGLGRSSGRVGECVCPVPSRHYLLAKAWVVGEDEKDTFNVPTNRTGCCRPVSSPPHGGSYGFAPGASLDDVAQGHG